MTFFEKTKGAVSIFLVIILVPMLTVASTFVDASKVKLARSVAESAGDLTLNTALTDYDTQLKELYGLMATAQDTSDLFAKLEDYYKTCITSSGVSNEDAATYAEQIMAQLGIVAESDNTSDIMNMQLTDFSAEKLSDADLANSSVIKRQIVDFMKYRAPINTGLSFISSLKGFSTLSKQTELVEKKQDYYEEQQKVMDYLKRAWEQIAKYNNTQIAKTDGYLSSAKENLDKFFKTGGGTEGYKGYKTLNEWLVMDLYVLYNHPEYLEYDTVIDQQNVKYKSPSGEKTERDIFTFKDDGKVKNDFSYYCKKYSKSNLPKESDIKTKIDKFYKDLNSVKTSKADFSQRKDGDYDLQYYVQAQRKGLTNFIPKVSNLYNDYQELKAMMIWIDGYKDAGKKDDEGNDITPETIKKSNYTTDDEGGKSFNHTIGDWFEEIEKKYKSEIGYFKDLSKKYSDGHKEAKSKYPKESDDAGKDVKKISDKVNGYVKELNTASTCLNNALTNLESAKTQLTTDVQTAKTNWNNVANDSSIKSTSLAKQDQAEIGQLDTYLNEKNIQKLIDRLTHIKENIDQNIEQIKGYKYDDKYIGEITDLSTLIITIESKWGNGKLQWVPVNKIELEGKATEWWTDSWTSGGLKADWVNQSNTQANLTKDQLAMYTYMSSHFGKTDAGSTSSTPSTKVEEEKKENGKDLYKKIKSKSKSAADNKSKDTDGGQANKNTKDKNITGDELPSKLKNTGSSDTPSGKKSTNIDKKDGEKGAAGKAAGSLGGLFGDGFLSAVTKMGTDLRDKLYVSDYIMSMFSYDTIENQYNVNKGKAVGTEIAAGSILSLTKNDISEANNYAYGSEIEYIIYGGKNSSNLTKAYGTIYAIRFGFNLVYAFATSEIRESAFAIATPISAATLGVIPVPLIQAVIIIGMACCESAMDLLDLRNGKKIPLYKSNQTWHCSISGLINAAKEQAGTIIKNTVNYAVSEGINKLNELLDMSDEKLNEAIKDGTNAIETSVGNAYDQIITKNAEAAIQQLTTLVNSAVQSAMCLDPGELYSNKKSEMKTWVKNQLQDWKNQQSGDDLASKVKREAADIILNNSGTYIDALFDTVEKSVKSGSDAGGNISSALSGVTTTDDGIDKLGGEVMKFVNSIKLKITQTITKGGGKIQEYKDKAVEKVRDSMNGGAEKLKNTINEQIDGFFGTSKDTDNSTGAASFFSFAYSDYLRLFLLIGLYTNEEKIMLRTADVIQVNMAKCTSNDNYRLKNSAAYVKITAEIQVKPTLLALPLFADVKNNPVAKTNWYTIQYSGISGY